MGFQVNYEDAYEGNDLLPAGDYEVIVKIAEEKETKDKPKKYISVTLAIRNDIDQKYKNRLIFESVFKLIDTGKYNMRQFSTICKALQIPNGKTYAGLPEILADWTNKTAKVKVKHDTYNEKTNARVSFWGVTTFQGCNHVWPVGTDQLKEDGFAPVSGLSGIDDDVPF